MIRGRRHHRRGTVALEYAVAVPVLIMLLTAASDFAYLGLVEHQLGYAARAASRYGITGQGDGQTDKDIAPVAWCPGSTPADNGRIARIREIVAQSMFGILKADGLCLGLASYAGVQAVGKPEPFADINGNGRWDKGEAFNDVNGNGVWDADQGSAAAGGGEQIGVYNLHYETFPLTGLTPGLPASRRLQFNARVVVRNEPF